MARKGQAIQEDASEAGYQDLTGFDELADPSEPTKPQVVWKRVAPSCSSCRPGRRSFHHAVRVEGLTNRGAGASGGQGVLLVGGECEPRHRGQELQPLLLRHEPIDPSLNQGEDEVSDAFSEPATASASAATEGGQEPKHVLKTEWRAHRSELPQRLRGCSIAVLGDLLFIFGGLKLDTVTGKGPLGEGTYASNQVSGDLHVYHVAQGRWRGVQQERKGQNAEGDESTKAAGRSRDGPRKSVAGGRQVAAAALAAAGEPPGDAPEPEAYYTTEGEAPRARFEHAMAALEGRGRWLVVHGGRSAKHAYPIESSFVLEVKSKALCWARMHPGRVASGPGASQDHGQLLQSQARKKQFTRRGHTLCAVPDHPGRVVMFGGRMDSGEEGRICAELMMLDVNPSNGNYVILPNTAIGSGPVARVYHAGTIVRSFLIIFGGVGRKGEILNDLYLLHLGAMIWSKIHEPVEMDGLLWPSPRFGAASVAVQQPLSSGGEAMLIFGGLVELGTPILDEIYMLSFEGPLAAAGGGAAAGAQAFSVYPDSLVLSLWDRLHTNLSTLEHDQMQVLSKVSEGNATISNRIMELENSLVSEEGSMRLAEAAVAQGQQDLKAAARRLEEARQETERQRHELAEQIRQARARVEEVRGRVQHCEVTHTILELGRLLPPEQVQVLEEDAGARVSLASGQPGSYGAAAELGAGQEALLRRAGFWCAAPVAVDELALPPWPADGEEGARGKAKAAAAVPQRQIWEAGIQKELRLAGKLRHPNLVEYFGGTIYGDTLRLISEPPLVPLLVELKGRFNPSLDFGRGKGRLNVAMDVAFALEYLHSRGVAHRRVCIGRIYLRDAPRLVAKLGDLLPARIAYRAARECSVLAQSKQATSKGRRGAFTSAATSAALDVPADAAQGTAPAFTAVLPVYAPDPRSVDMLAFGGIALQLFCRDALPQGEGAGVAANSAAVSRIADRGVRLVVMRCMEKEPQNRMSAAAAARALEGAHRGDAFVGLEALAEDPSRAAPLLDPELDALAAQPQVQVADAPERRRDGDEDG